MKGLLPSLEFSAKKSIDIGASVVDEDYKGEVGAVLINNSDQDFPIKKGDRIT